MVVMVVRWTVDLSGPSYMIGDRFPRAEDKDESGNVLDEGEISRRSGRAIKRDHLKGVVIGRPLRRLRHAQTSFSPTPLRAASSTF